MTVEELQALVDNAEKSDLYVEVKKIGNKIILPIEALQAIIANNAGALKKPNDVFGRRKITQGPIKVASDNKDDGTTAALEVPVEKVWRMLAVQASFLMDANVADRSVMLAVPEIGLGGVVGASPTTFLSGFTLTPIPASEYGYLLMLGDKVGYKCLNGAITLLTAHTPMPLWLNAGGDLQAKIYANPQATDKTGIDILYREYDLTS